MSNHPNLDLAMNLASRVGSNVKTLRENKRQLYASVILAVKVENFDRKATLDDVKRKAKYGTMDKADQALLRRELSNVSTVIDNWPHFTDAQREAFINGTIASEDAQAFPDFDGGATLVVSSLAALCKARDKAADKADKGDNGEGVADEAPADAPAADCENFTIEQMVAMILAGDERTIPLHDAIEQFNAAAVMVESTGTNG